MKFWKVINYWRKNKEIKKKNNVVLIAVAEENRYSKQIKRDKEGKR